MTTDRTRRFRRLELAAQLSREFSTLSPGSRIPGGHVLAERLGAPYMTVVHALDELTLRGEIIRIPNKGSYIAEHRVRELFFLTPCPAAVYSYDTEVLDGVVREARHMGIRIRTIPVTQTNRLADIDWNSLGQLPDGAGVILSSLPDYCLVLGYLRERHCRIALLDNRSEGTSRHFAAELESFHRVVTPRGEAVVQALELFKAAGKNRVLLLHQGAHEDNPVRAAFRRGLADLGMPFSSKLELLIGNGYYSALGHLQTFLWQEYEFNAVLCATSASALACCDLFKRHKIRVPEDVAVIALNDAPVLETNDVAVTAVFWDPETAGQELVKLLVARNPQPETVRLPVCVARRKSV